MKSKDTAIKKVKGFSSAYPNICNLKLLPNTDGTWVTIQDDVGTSMTIKLSDLSDLYNEIKNRTPLPKRMLSVDLIIETLCPKDEDYDYPCIAPSYLEKELERLLLDDAPTIIESNKEGDCNV